MHELGVAESILGVAIGLADGHPVERVTVRVGALHRTAADSLAFGFGLLAEGTEAAGAALDVVEVRARLRCVACGIESEFDGALPICSTCGAGEISILSGEELLVEEIVLTGVAQPLRAAVSLVRTAAGRPRDVPDDATHDRDGASASPSKHP